MLDVLGDLGEATGLPVPAVHARPATAASTTHVALTTMDRSGRLADRSAVRFMAWQPGRSVRFEFLEGNVVITSVNGGTEAHSISSDGFLRLPADIRTCAKLKPRDRLLVVADRNHNIVIGLPPAKLYSILKTCTRHGPPQS